METNMDWNPSPLKKVGWFVDVSLDVAKKQQTTEECDSSVHTPLPAARGVSLDVAGQWGGFSTATWSEEIRKTAIPVPSWKNNTHI